MRKIFPRPKVSLLRYSFAFILYFCLYPLQFRSDRFFFSRILQPLSNSRGVLPPFCFLFCSSFIDNLYTQTKFENKTFECAMECLQRSVFLLGKKYSPIRVCNRMSSKGCIFTGKKVLPNSK